MTTYCPVKGVGPQSPADNDFAGGFASALMLKDLGLAMQGAKGVNAQVPMGELAAKWFEMHCEEGNAGMDFSSIINRLAACFCAVATSLAPLPSGIVPLLFSVPFSSSRSHF